MEPRHNTNAGVTALVSSAVAKLQAELGPGIAATAGSWITALKEAIRIEYAGVTVGLGGDYDAEELDIVGVLVQLLELAERHKKTGVVLFLDEAQTLTDERVRNGEHPLSSLLAAVNVLQSQGAPIGLALSGLPTLHANLLQARTYAERMFRGLELRELAPADAAAAITLPLEGREVSFSAELVERLVRNIHGFPYFLEAWSASLWDYAAINSQQVLELSDLLSASDEIQLRLDDEFYEPRLQALTRAEYDLVLAAAEVHTYPPLSFCELQSKSNKKPANTNNLIGRLIAQGLIYRDRKGEYVFSIPGYFEFLQRRKLRSENFDRPHQTDEPAHQCE